jgi:uncharacterized protein YxeA
MKQILILILTIFTSITSAQTQEKNYAIRQSIDENIYFNAFRNFDLDSLCEEEVIVTFLNKNKKSYQLKGLEVSKKLKRWIHKPGMSYYFIGTSNNGFVISISQVNSDEIYTKFLTIFTSYETGKIVVIEISENEN